MVRHLAFSGTMLLILFGMAALLATSTAAIADPTTLICIADAANVWKDDEPSTIELNEAQSSIAVHFAAQTGILGPQYRVSAHASGPIRATFGADTISFSDQGFDYTLNRLTGSLLRLVGSDVALRWTCQPGKKQF